MNPATQSRPGKSEERRKLGYTGDIFDRGPVAQLGARFHGMEEVVSSNLTRSTKLNPNKTGSTPNNGGKT